MYTCSGSGSNPSLTNDTVSTWFKHAWHEGAFIYIMQCLEWLYQIYSWVATGSWGLDRERGHKVMYLHTLEGPYGWHSLENHMYFGFYIFATPLQLHLTICPKCGSGMPSQLSSMEGPCEMTKLTSPYPIPHPSPRPLPDPPPFMPPSRWPFLPRNRRNPSYCSPPRTHQMASTEPICWGRIAVEGKF